MPVPDETISSLPIRIDYQPDLPVSGASDWDKHRKSWVIVLDATEPATRRRFSLFHEYKHVIDHGHPGLVQNSSTRRTYYGRPAVEYLADYFAGCVLMPRPLLKAAYADGIQQPWELAQLFAVSTKAMTTRLSQIGLAAPDDNGTRATPLARFGLTQRHVRLKHRYPPQLQGSTNKGGTT
jgi:Zn-dependent peptidase ImmA (M78 family)